MTLEPAPAVRASQADHRRPRVLGQLRGDEADATGGARHHDDLPGLRLHGLHAREAGHGRYVERASHVPRDLGGHPLSVTHPKLAPVLVTRARLERPPAAFGAQRRPWGGDGARLDVPARVRHRAPVSSDPLSDILRLTEATSVMSGGFVAGGTWSLRFPPPENIVFAVTAKGGCSFRLDGEKRVVRGEQGDVALISGPRGYVVASSLAAPPVDALRLFALKKGPLAQVGKGSDCVVLAGGVSLHPSSAALLTDVLPALVLVRSAASEAPALRWIVEQILLEEGASRPGSSIACAQLAQLLFTQILRAHLTSSVSGPPGWLRAVGDARVAPALRMMHDDPARAWKLAELAKAAGMSRTSFAQRFKAITGVTPLGYLTEWRMRLGQRALRQEEAPLSEIAARLGYASESAFSQAFKRVTGTRPRDYRSAQRRAALVEAG